MFEQFKECLPLGRSVYRAGLSLDAHDGAREEGGRRGGGKGREELGYVKMVENSSRRDGHIWGRWSNVSRLDFRFDN